MERIVPQHVRQISRGLDQNNSSFFKQILYGLMGLQRQNSSRCPDAEGIKVTCR